MLSLRGVLYGFPVLICDLAVGTDAIIGTDVLGSVLPHSLDIKKGLLFTEGGASLQLHSQDSALSGRVFMVGHCSIPPFSEAVLHCSVRITGGRPMPSSGLLEGLTVFAENTGLVVGRTLVDPSQWKVPVLVSNFSQDTIVVDPFSEVGMIAQVSAIQSITEPLRQSQDSVDSLPAHLQDRHAIWMIFNNVTLRMSCYNIRTCFLPQDRLSPVILMQWNMKSTPAIVRRYVVHPAECHLRK